MQGASSFDRLSTSFRIPLSACRDIAQVTTYLPATIPGVLAGANIYCADEEVILIMHVDVSGPSEQVYDVRDVARSINDTSTDRGWLLENP